MSSIEKIAKLTGQYDKEMELAEKYRNKAKEQAELAEKHIRKAEVLEKQIKYEKGGEVFDRVNALNLSPDELQLLLKLLDDKTQLIDVVRMSFPERFHDTAGDEQEESGENEVFSEIPVFGEEYDDEKGEENWDA